MNKLRSKTNGVSRKVRREIGCIYAGLVSLQPRPSLVRGVSKMTRIMNIRYVCWLLVGSVVIGLVMFMPQTIGHVPTAEAHHTGYVDIGQANDAMSETEITNIGTAPGNGRALHVRASRFVGGEGLYAVGYGPWGSGVRAFSYDSDGVYAQGNNGVRAHGGTNGVYGDTSDPNGSGVYGENNGGGYGVTGRSNTGTAVLAESTGGNALVVNGFALFSRSGKLTIPAGAHSITKTGVVLTTGSLVFATLQENRPGIYVRAAIPNVSMLPPPPSSFTIYLNDRAPANTTVAWFIVN